jgi:hypothetical protein
VAVAAAGGIAVTVAALRAHASHPAMAERGCAAVGNLAFKNPSNQEAAAAAGAVEAVVAAMRAQAHLPAVQERGAAALGNLGFRHVANQARVSEAHGVEAIVDAMSRFSDKAGVQEQGFRALRNLSALDDASLRAAAQGHAQIPNAAVAAANTAAAVAARGGASAGGAAPQPLPKGLSGLPAALRAYLEKLQRQNERACVPLSALLKQLETQLDQTWGETSAVLSEAAALRARVRTTMETLEINVSGPPCPSMSHLLTHSHRPTDARRVLTLPKVPALSFRFCGSSTT